MAQLAKYLLSKNNDIFKSLIMRNNTNILSCRFYANKKYKQKLKKVEVPECRKLKSTQDSFAARGFLRGASSYEPPRDVESRLERLYSGAAGGRRKEEPLDPEAKYSLLTSASEEFKHTVPNSLLHTIQTYDDVVEFYKTAVDGRLPLDRLKNSADLPANLHIIAEPTRFLPDEDTMFQSKTAFPGSSTLVTGLKTRKKYRGHRATQDPWPMGIRDI